MTPPNPGPNPPAQTPPSAGPKAPTRAGWMTAERTRRLLYDHGLAWRLVLALLVIYGLGLLAFYPSSYTNTDESQYVRQAVLFAQGERMIERIDPVEDAPEELHLSFYPPGTSLTLTPFVWAFGWQGAFLAPYVFLALGILILARWLADEGHSPLFALLAFGFVPCLVLGRVPLSGVPSMTAVALGLWLFWRGLDRSKLYWLGSGFVAGASVLLREPNALVFVPFYAGTVLRRDRGWWALLVGGLVGIALRPLLAWLVFDDPLYVKSGYYFRPFTFYLRLPYYAFGLLVLVPGGFIAALAYRGRRWPELVGCVLLFTLFFLTQKHGAAPSGPARALVTALRYFIPLLPVITLAMAEVVPRVWAQWIQRRDASRQPALERLAARGVVVWVAGLATASLVVHAALGTWTDQQARIRDGIEEVVAPDSVVITNWEATEKFLCRERLQYLPVKHVELPSERAGELLERYGRFYVVMLDRSDSEYRRQSVRETAAYVDALDVPLTLELDRRLTPTDHLRIWSAARP